jgi:hypothetical protein
MIQPTTLSFFNFKFDLFISSRKFYFLFETVKRKVLRQKFKLDQGYIGYLFHSSHNFKFFDSQCSRL